MFTPKDHWHELMEVYSCQCHTIQDHCYAMLTWINNERYFRQDHKQGHCRQRKMKASFYSEIKFKYLIQTIEKQMWNISLITYSFTKLDDGFFSS